MSEMVERVALAMKQRAALPVANLKSLERVIVGSLGDTWIYLAEAAIAAMREPTETMLVAARKEVFDGDGWEISERIFEAGWRAMCDAELAEPQAGHGNAA